MKIFITKYFPNEIQDKHTKNSQEKIISLKQHYILFISDTCVSNKGWDLIQNDNDLRYHKELTEKQVQLHWTPQHLKVKDIESNKKLMPHYDRAKNQLNSLIKS